jgi:hypothetical protein
MWSVTCGPNWPSRSAYKDFAQATGINHRMIQRRIRGVYRITPQVWLCCMKLNAFRRESQQSSDTDEGISDITTR